MSASTTYRSNVEQRGPVQFPAFTAERIYMREFRQCDGLPKDLARWQPTVDQMLDGIETDGPIYLMVDQGVTQIGKTHRRPGLHIDGYWSPGGRDHRGNHIAAMPKWNGDPDWRDNINGQSPWGHIDLSTPEAIILASDVIGCCAFVGEYDTAHIKEGGAANGVDTFGLQRIVMNPNRAYSGNVGMLHASIPHTAKVQRTLVRLNVPGWEPK